MFLGRLVHGVARDRDKTSDEGDEAEPMVRVAGVEVVKTTKKRKQEDGGQSDLLGEGLVEGGHDL